MENANNAITEIKNNVQIRSSSRKDEAIVMKAIINDPEFSVDVYDNDHIEKYHPGKEFRKIVSNAISTVTKLPHKEAEDLLNQYEFSKSDALSMVNLSKEFISIYLQTGRKLRMGNRKTSAVELMWKEIPAKETKVPNRHKSGKNFAISYVPAHEGIKAMNPCPDHIRKK